MTVLVTTATGNVGRHVVDGLSRAGVAVKAITRDPERAADLFAREGLSTAGVEFIQADMAAHSAIRRAAEACSQAYIACSDGPDQVMLEVNAARAALDTGATHVIKLSSCDAALDAAVSWGRQNGQVESQIRDMTDAFTFLRPHFFMQNLFDFADEICRDGTISVSAGSGRMGMIDARDIAAVAASLLLNKAPLHRGIELTGPAPVSFSEVADAISAAVGRDVRYVEISEQEHLRRLVEERKVTPETAADIVHDYRDVRNGASAVHTGEVEAITGRKPRSVRQFAADFAHEFRQEHR